MPTLNRPSGVRITVPTTVTVTDASAPAAPTAPTAPAPAASRGAPSGRVFGPVPLPTAPAARAELTGEPSASDTVVGALRDQGLDMIDRIVLETRPIPPDRRRA